MSSYSYAELMAGCQVNPDALRERRQLAWAAMHILQKEGDLEGAKHWEDEAQLSERDIHLEHVAFTAFMQGGSYN